MPGDAPIYLSRLLRLPLLDSDGHSIGRIEDVIFSAPAGAAAPRVLGFVITLTRRKIFVNATRVEDVDALGVRLSAGRVDLRGFRKRPGELDTGNLIDRRIGNEVLRDVGLLWSAATREWVVSSIALSQGGGFGRRRKVRVLPWADVAANFVSGRPVDEFAEVRAKHPADIAAVLQALNQDAARRLLAGLEDDVFADVLQELPEDEQVRIVGDLGLERAADIIGEMDPDDAADLLAELPAAERSAVLEEMEPDEAGPLRRLLTYDSDTAGGLMTSEPIVGTPLATVAWALARVRDPNVPLAVAAQVFVAEPPTTTPTGQYLGVVTFQRLLAESPATTLGDILSDEVAPVSPDMPQSDVAGRLAAYNLLALPVVDPAGHLLGVATVDDVLEVTLPEGWREAAR